MAVTAENAIGATVILYAGYKAIGGGYRAIEDWLSHHPSEVPKTLAGVEVIIKEEATKWNAHKIKLTITWSPENKVTGRWAEKDTWHAKTSREKCFKVLEDIVKKAYQK